MSKQKRQNQTQRKPAAAPPPRRSLISGPWLWLGLVALVAITVTGLVIWQGKRAPAVLPTPQPTRVIGSADSCRAGPRFQTALNLGQQAALVSTLTNIKGLAIMDPDGDQGRGRVYQHETWDDAGFIGPFITDRKGNIYLSPVPLVSLQENPPELQNRVYRVDTDSQVMSLFTELPAPPATGSGNPFGAVGLAYDCATESLYVSSLAGSTARQEQGRLYQVDLKTGNVVSQWDGVDALGLAVFNGVDGKRLYYGLARKPEVHSVALDDTGRIVGDSRPEFSFASLAKGGRDSVRRIRIDANSRMKLNLMDFTFSLQVASERQEDELSYTYDPTQDIWTPAP